MRTGDFASASATLLEALTLYDTRDVEMGYLLPYLAFAGAKAGQSAAVDGILEKFSPEFRRFDYYLAKAALAGVGGKVADSIKYLELARYRRPFTEYRPLQSEYQLAEISEWLYESTRDIRFRDFAVTWARHVQTTEPSSAWAYAMEAKLTRNAQDRRRSIAMTYYLDRGSDRLKSIPASEVKAAVKEYAARNPFLKANAAATRGAT
jgi:hypothetical protein